MKRWLVVILGILIATGAFAAPRASDGSELRDEIESILAAKAAVPIGTLTVGDLEKLAGQISVAVQKSAYVRRAGIASFMVPGMGQFLTGNPAGGALFLTGDLAFAAGAMVGAYFLLPERVRIGSGTGTGAGGLDYLNTSMTRIKEVWSSGSPMEYLPSMGVMAAGMLANRLLALWASGDAAGTAKRNIADGKVTFQPEILPMLGPMGPGMGMRMSY
jgi:hypothetical protein